MRPIRRAQALDLKIPALLRALALYKEILEFAPHHQRYHLFVLDVDLAQFAGVAPVAQGHRPISNLLDLS
jgi:hypothetical protein